MVVRLFLICSDGDDEEIKCKRWNSYRKIYLIEIPNSGTTHVMFYRIYLQFMRSYVLYER